MNVKMEQFGDLKINGSGTTTGGIFKAVKISGSGKVTGDVECIEMKISGSGVIEGAIKADTIITNGSSSFKNRIETKRMEVSGSSVVTGHLSADELLINGSIQIKDNVKCGSLQVNGSSKFEGELAAEKIKVSGTLKVANDCEAEHFYARGSISIAGLLNADHIELLLDFHSRVKEIGGEKIIIKNHVGLNLIKRLYEMILQRRFHLETEIIEGDYIEIEATKANLVRGTNVHILDKCEIEVVEYKDSINIHPGAIVKKKIQL